MIHRPHNSPIVPREMTTTAAAAAAANDDDDTASLPADIFALPESYTESSKPYTYQTYHLKNARILHLRLVGFDALWVPLPPPPFPPHT